MKMKKIVVTNDKGGASKSTTSFQVLGAYFLYKNIDAEIVEFDDENKDSKNFVKSQIKTRQVRVGSDVSVELKNSILKEFTDSKNTIYDVGGNKTTTIFFDALRSTRMFKKVDLWVIPASGGHQDIENMKKIYNKIKELDANANILLSLSRVRNMSNYEFQYRKLFADKELSALKHIVIEDSDAIDLSRDMKKSAYEIAIDNTAKQEFEKKFNEMINKKDIDQNQIIQLSNTLGVFDDSEKFLNEVLYPAFQTIESIIRGDNNDK